MIESVVAHRVNLVLKRLSLLSQNAFLRFHRSQLTVIYPSLNRYYKQKQNTRNSGGRPHPYSRLIGIILMLLGWLCDCLGFWLLYGLWRPGLSRGYIAVMSFTLIALAFGLFYHSLDLVWPEPKS